VIQGYGLTETAPIVTVTHPFHIKRGSVGKAIAGVDVAIAPDGEILVRGDNVTSGYFHADVETAKAFAGAPKCDARILLAHQPKSLRAALPHGFDLQISGHTHGGQFFPWNLLAAVDQPYVSGFHRHENSWIYVSRGTGYWGPPVRIAARSEMTLFTLTRG